MPRKQEPSDWTPADIKMLGEGEAKYKGFNFEGIAALVPGNDLNFDALKIGSPKGKSAEGFVKDVTAVGGWLHMGLHYEGRATIPEVRSGLDSAYTKLSELNECILDSIKLIHDLDHETMRHIEDAAHQDPGDEFRGLPRDVEIYAEGYVERDEEGKVKAYPRPMGRFRVTDRNKRLLDTLNIDFSALDDLIRWTARAQKQLPAGVAGSKGTPATQTAVNRLYEVWMEHAGDKTRPTGINTYTGDGYPQEPGGKFLEFCRGALFPILGSDDGSLFFLVSFTRKAIHMNSIPPDREQ